MKDVSRLLALLFVLTIAVLSGCDSPQQATTENKIRIELGPHENAKTYGDYTVHVNVLTTDQLPADVARSYNISRSKSRGMLNVVITKNIDGVDKPVTATVSTVTRNLASQLKNMEIREIVEQDAIYYIGDVQVDNEEILIFNIDVAPENKTNPFLLAYRHQFFTN